MVQILKTCCSIYSFKELILLFTLTNIVYGIFHRERQKIHLLRVEAFDLGIPTPLQSDLDLTVYVKNVNDHEPQFLVDEFAVNFTEHRSPGSERALLVSAVDRDVEDDETAALLDICYFIVGGNNDGYFDLFPREHELVAARELGRIGEMLFLLEWSRCEKFLLGDTRALRAEFRIRTS